jgi:hypothetical protein
MKKVVAFIGALLLVICSFGQEIKVPGNYHFKKAKDYALYKDSVVKVAKWMVNNPLTIDHKTRIAANKFVLAWVSGAPDTHVEIKPEFTSEVTQDKTNIYVDDLYMDYVAGMVLVKINNNKADELEAQEAGMKAMLRGYESVVNFCTIKFLDSLQKQEDKGKLAEWIKAKSVKSETKDKKE